MKISVALCTYNGEKYIEQQLESIFTQTMPVSEVVICDDCSSDRTIQKVKQISSSHPGVIRLIVNSQNLGFNMNFRKAVGECQGDYIFLCDQDDVWRPDKVEKSITYLRNSGNYGVFTNADLIDANNRKVGLSLFECLHIDQYIKFGDFYPDLFTSLCLFANMVTGACVAISIEAKRLLLASWPSDVSFHDYYIGLKLSAIGKLGYLTDKLVLYRIHPDQQIGVNIEITKKAHLFDFAFFLQSHLFFPYLLRRRINSLSVISEYKLGRMEVMRLGNSYKAYVFTILKGYPMPYRLRAFALFYTTELCIPIVPLIKWFRTKWGKICKGKLW